ncbi:sulfotransferase [Porticoccaceae bacterium]|nr:sulfotransferase [Porticoccaceae bacterium]
MDPQQEFFQALTALREGNLDRCEEICERLQAINPRDVNTLRLRAQVFERRGDLIEAEQGFSAAIDIADDFAHAWADLGKVQYALKKYPQSESSLRRALALDGKLKGPSNLLAQLLKELGKADQSEALDSINAQRAALKEKVYAAYRMATAGDIAGAETQCREVLKQDPDNVGAKEFLIERALESGRARWAEELSRSLIRNMPERPKWWLKLASALSRQDQVAEAEEAAQQALSIDPDKTEGRMLLGSIFSKDNRFPEALEQYDLVLQQRPDYVPALSQKATVLKTFGQQEEAIETYQRCMRLDPKHGEAAWSLSNLKTYRFTDDEVDKMIAVLAAGDLSDQQTVHFSYALGKAYEHREDWQRAFESYACGNLVKKKLVDWSPDRFTQQVDNIIQTFSAEFVEKNRTVGIEDDAAIFILGLPRSGSTLQEQILASHSQVEGTRELPYIPWLAQRMNRPPQAMASQAYPLGASDLNNENWQSIGQQFIQQAQRHRQTDAPFFIDKLPNNFLYVGLILLAMPNAKIINTVRHPMDNCFGCFKQLWAEGQYFAYDLDDLGRYYRDYIRLMAHWQRVFPGKIHSVNYEEVVDNLEHNVSQLLDYCALPMEEQCLRFHETERAVNTASSEQVRQPIYKSAVAYWKHFEKDLQPLKDALGDLATD